MTQSQNAVEEKQAMAKAGVSRLGVTINNVVYLPDSTTELTKFRFDARVGKFVFRGISGECSLPNKPTFKSPWNTKICTIAQGEDEYRVKIETKIEDELIAILSVGGADNGGWDGIN